jgi:hypothetical protein
MARVVFTDMQSQYDMILEAQEMWMETLIHVPVST